MSHLGLSEDLVALRERVGNAPATSGALGAMAYPAPDGAPRHSTRSASWREYAEGTLLQVERGPRQGRPMVLLTGASPDAMFRAAVDAVASCFETGMARPTVRIAVRFSGRIARGMCHKIKPDGARIHPIRAQLYGGREQGRLGTGRGRVRSTR